MTTIKIQQLTDAQLVENFINTKDSRFFGEIYNRYHKKAYHLALTYTKDKSEAYDLVQEIFLKIMEKVDTLKNYEVLSFWIYNVARNTCSDYYRGQKKNHNMMSFEEQYDVAEEVADIDNLLLDDRKHQILKEALATLNVEDQQLLMLKYFNNYSIKDFQNQLGIGSSAVKMRLKRARVRVLKHYQQAGIFA